MLNGFDDFPARAQHPPTTLLWPHRYLDTVCTTMSMPHLSGFWYRGVAYVLSMAVPMPGFWRWRQWLQVLHFEYSGGGLSK